ncbi:glycoside hydrolase family 172 protein [Pseudokineococcus basanitobsidens]
MATLRPDARTRSASPENPAGEPGGGGGATDGTGAAAARDLGRGWKVSPSVEVAPGATHPLLEATGSGVVQHLWVTTHPRHWRELVLRMHWDGDPAPAVEVPLGDFFGQGWGEFAQLSSQVVAANPHGGLNSYWRMPFRRGARITLDNLGADAAVVYYQVTWSEEEVGEHEGYLHAQWRRDHPLERGRTHVLLDGVEGAGHYVGTYLAWGVNSSGWWGEGEVKFYLDDDDDLASVCGTGTEDYFGGAWNFDVPGQGYTTYSTPYLGLHQVLRPDGLYRSQQRFGMYRWHLPDPVRFRSALRVDVQALGWRSGGRYLPLADDIASTAFLYLDRTSTSRPSAPGVDEMEVL